jgi:hypothetical protein
MAVPRRAQRELVLGNLSPSRLSRDSCEVFPLPLLKILFVHCLLLYYLFFVIEGMVYILNFGATKYSLQNEL